MSDFDFDDELPFNRATLQDEEYGFISPFQRFPERLLDGLIREVRGAKDFVDLGCGDGTVIIAVVERLDISAHGVDLDENLIQIAKQRAQQHNVSEKVSFEVNDLRNSMQDLQTDVVFLFLVPDALKLIGNQLMEKMFNGDVKKVISFFWGIKELNTDGITLVKEQDLYIYTVSNY